MSDTKTTIFAIMSALSQEYGAINLAQGFPGFACSKELVDAAYRYMLDGYNQYSPLAGSLELRQSIASKVGAAYGISLSPESEICVTAGATEALFVAIQSLVSKNDEVIIFEPAFDIYKAAIERAGGIPIPIPLSFPDYSIDWTLVWGKITNHTKLIIINSPHNPTGSIISAFDLDVLEQLVDRFGIWILSDEVYEHMVYDSCIHHSVLMRPQLRKRSLVTYSLGKTFHVTGWRLGYCIAPEVIMRKFREIHQYVTFAAATPLQLACAQHLNDSKNYLHLASFFEGKRDLFVKALLGSGLVPIPCKGTYFQLMKYDDLYTIADVELAKILTKEAKVASIPISVFYHDKKDDHILRFCFAKDDDELLEAAHRLKNHFR